MKIKQVKAYKIRKALCATFAEAKEYILDEITVEVYDAVYDEDGVMRKTKTAVKRLKKALSNGLKSISRFEKEKPNE